MQKESPSKGGDNEVRREKRLVPLPNLETFLRLVFLAELEHDGQIERESIFEVNPNRATPDREGRRRRGHRESTYTAFSLSEEVFQTSFTF